ncbi:MAG: alpha/beta hydrolase [Massilia sp.]
MRTASRLISIALLAALSCQVNAGPLRDRLEARRAAKQAEKDGKEGQDAKGEKLPAGVQLVRNVSYGADKAQRFDVYLPKGAANAPVIFLVHGGGWKHGDKNNDRVVDNKLAYWSARGYILISTDYRMLPEADPLTQARDVASAIAAAQDKAASWGGDRNKFILVGHSAGAHLVTLLSSSSELRGNLHWLGTVSLDSAAYDVEQIMQGHHMRLYDEPFGKDPAYWKSVSPYAQLSQAGQPLLAVCSSRRADSCPQAKQYAAKATSLGMRVQLLPEDLSHMEINETLGQDSAYTQAVDQFIRTLVPGKS